MLAKTFSLLTCLLAVVGLALAQTATQPADSAKDKADAEGWRTPGANPKPKTDGAAADPSPPLRPISSTPREPIAKVTKGPGSLPNDGGQEWRDYDISPYTTRVTTTNRPEQALVDWILRETGYEAWHGEPLGLLSANRRTLRVYHTPQMHLVVAEMVDRFVSTEAQSNAFALRVISIGSPNWRTKAHRMLHSVTVQSQGVQAWLLAKEDAALLLADFRKRSDFKEHSSPHLTVNNGQSTVVAASQTRNYVRDVLLRGDVWPGFEPQSAQLDEGFSLEFSPLLSLDGRSIDAVIKCNVDQVEKMIPVLLDVPTSAAPRQRTKIEVPQISSCRLHERFHWPIDQVLVISMGVVASPVSTPSALNVKLPLLDSPSRADLLVIVENKGKAPANTAASRPAGSTR